MTQTNSLPPPLDSELERRRVLAKVYSLLLRLAEEAEYSSVLPDSVEEDKEEIEEQSTMQAIPLDESSHKIDPEVSVIDSERSDNSVP